MDVDIQVSKLPELVHGLWTRQWISVQRRCYEKLYCVSFKRDILEASREFVVCLF